MVYSVEKSFDYANLFIDFENKKYSVTYPHVTPKIMEWLMFGVVSLVLSIIPALLISFILFLFGIEEVGFFVWILLIVLSMIFCFKTRYVREAIIKLGEETDGREINQVYIEGIKKKKVTIKNVGNYLTEYELYGDYKKYIKTFEIKCVKCIKSKHKWQMPKYHWMIVVVFSKIPKSGKMLIKNQRGGNDEVIGDGNIIVEYH